MIPRHTSSFAAVVLLVGTATFFNALADSALMPLGELVGASDLIIIGNVTAVDEQADTGLQKATIRIEVSILGAPPAKLKLVGNRFDPGLPQFYPKMSIIAFLAKNDTGFVPVAGEHGVMQLGPDAQKVTLRIVKQVAERGEYLQLANVQYALRTSSPALPIVLESSLLEELSLRSTQREASLIEDMACSSRGDYRNSAQRWAIYRIGMLKLVKSRPCLEQLTLETRLRDVRILAVEALGNLGDAGALGTLLSMLPVPSTHQAPPVIPRGGDDEGLLHKSAPDDKDGDSKGDHLEDPEKVPSNASDPAESKILKQHSKDTLVSTKTEPVTGSMPLDRDLVDAALLALGKIGAEKAIAALQSVALKSDDLSLSSTAVHALGLIGTPKAYDSLVVISETSRNALIRDQVTRTVQRLRLKAKE